MSPTQAVLALSCVLSLAIFADCQLVGISAGSTAFIQLMRVSETTTNLTLRTGLQKIGTANALYCNTTECKPTNDNSQNAFAMDQADKTFTTTGQMNPASVVTVVVGTEPAPASPGGSRARRALGDLTNTITYNFCTAPAPFAMVNSTKGQVNITKSKDDGLMTELKWSFTNGTSDGWMMLPSWVDEYMPKDVYEKLGKKECLDVEIRAVYNCNNAYYTKSTITQKKICKDSAHQLVASAMALLVVMATSLTNYL